ncbi:MAG: hypothetical protein ACTSYX_10885, partial [Candidatus Thorarchaeota archaeon]
EDLSIPSIWDLFLKVVGFYESAAFNGLLSIPSIWDLFLKAAGQRHDLGQFGADNPFHVECSCLWSGCSYIYKVQHTSI